MSRIPALLIAALLFSSPVFAQDTAPAPAAVPAPAPAAAADSGCEAKAVDKHGKALTGAAKTSFMKKCAGPASDDGCAAKAVGKNGKPLAGSAKTSFMKKCHADQKTK